MGRGRFLWEVAMAVVLVTAILCSNKCEAAAVAAVARGSSYGGNMAMELMMVSSHVDIFPLLPRFEQFENDIPITETSGNPNSTVCNNGQGNQFGSCGGTASNTQVCNKYDNNGKCVG